MTKDFYGVKERSRREGGFCIEGPSYSPLFKTNEEAQVMKGLLEGAYRQGRKDGYSIGFEDGFKLEESEYTGPFPEDDNSGAA